MSDNCATDGTIVASNSDTEDGVIMSNNCATGTIESTSSDTKDSTKQHHSSLTGREICNLVSLVLAYACVICSTTLVVGTSAVIVLSVGGSSQLSPFALAMFFVGSAFISLVISSIFQHFGRKIGFLVGVLFGLMGALLGCIAIVISSPALVIVASMPLGAANGIGFYLRFAAVEVVSERFKSLAVTLVLSGGVIAAFVGPETAQATRDIFGSDLTYLGTYMMIGIFNFLDACFTLVVKFPNHKQNVQTTKIDVETSGETLSHGIESEDSHHSQEVNTVTLKSLLFSISFLVPCAMATASWCIMAMPMSIVRVAMKQVGFTSRQSLTTIELHFLGMYGPGFITGKIIDRCGAYVTGLLGIASFLIATIVNLLSDTSENGSLATWIVGMCVVGVGWNLGFSSATVMLTRVYEKSPEFKARVQAANDFFMFLISGGTTFSTGYIFNAGGGMLNGWKTVNYVVLGMIGVISAILVPAFVREKQRLSTKCSEEETDNEEIMKDDELVAPSPAYNEGTGFELSYDFRSIHSSN